MLGRTHYAPHGPTTFLKSVATTVVLAFSMLILTPTVVAARDQYGRSQRWIEPAPSSETRLALAVDDVRALLERLDGRLVRAKETGAERWELRRLRGEIADLDRAVLEDFAEVFRLYVTWRGRMKDLLADLGRRRKDPIVYEKFLLLNRFIRSLRGWR